MVGCEVSRKRPWNKSSEPEPRVRRSYEIKHAQLEVDLGPRWHGCEPGVTEKLRESSKVISFKVSARLHYVTA